VRAALGATRGEITTLVLRQGVRLAAAGGAIGVLAAAIASRGLTSLLFAVSPLDPLTYATVVGTLGAVTILACAAPAWRAARVDPAVTLRSE
jgi:putative ABC transport system permease protein